MRDQVNVSTSKCRDEILGLRTRGGRQQFGCPGPSVEDFFVVHWVGVGIGQAKGRQGSSSNGRADSLVELEEPEPGQRVRGVVGQSEGSQQIFYVGRLDEPQTPVLDVGNSSTPELELEQIRVVRGACQHRLLAEGDAFLSVRQYLFADRQHLSILVGTSNEAGAYSGLNVRGLEHGGEPLWSFGSYRIRHVKNWLAGSVIGAENYRPRSREDLFEIQDVTRFSSTERVDRLCVVSDDGDSIVSPAQRLQNVYLQSVHVLVFIDQYVIERTRKPWAQPVIKGGGPPEQEKVVEVEHASRPFAGDVPATNLDDLLDNVVRPRRHCRRYRRDRPPRVYGSGIEVEEKCLAWEPLAAGLRVATLFSNEVHDVGRIGGVQHGETFGDTERLGVSPQSSVCDRVKRPPHDAAGRRIGAAVPLLCGQHHASPIQHLPRHPARESQQENPFRRSSRRQQPRDAGRECGCLARPGTCKNPKRPAFMAGGCSLGLIELLRPSEHMFDSSGSGSYGAGSTPSR